MYNALGKRYFHTSIYPQISTENQLKDSELYHTVIL